MLGWCWKGRNFGDWWQKPSDFRAVQLSEGFILGFFKGNFFNKSCFRKRSVKKGNRYTCKKKSSVFVILNRFFSFFFFLGCWRTYIYYTWCTAIVRIRPTLRRWFVFNGVSVGRHSCWSKEAASEINWRIFTTVADTFKAAKRKQVSCIRRISIYPHMFLCYFSSVNKFLQITHHRRKRNSSRSMQFVVH